MSLPTVKEVEEKLREFTIDSLATIVTVLWENPETHERYKIEAKNEASIWEPGLHITTEKIEV